MAFWNRRKTAEQNLLSSFLTLEQKRVEAMGAQELQRQALELKKLELEIEHQEETAKVRREDREATLKLKQQQREWAATSREKKKQLAAAAKTHGGTLSSENCPVCQQRMDLTVADIAFHHSGHTNPAMDLFH